MTLQQITARMHNIEKIISFYNSQYHYDILKAPLNVQQHYHKNLATWDQLKIKRDLLKARQNLLIK